MNLSHMGKEKYGIMCIKGMLEQSNRENIVLEGEKV